MGNSGLMDEAKKVLLGNYKTAPVLLERGEGLRLWDSEGKEYLDMIAGIATCSLGHCHPKLVAALEAQAKKLWHVSNAFYSAPNIMLAERLTKASGLDRAFFCNSGAEANEALIKLARKYQHDKGTGRFEIITAENSFHGRTLAAVTATGQPKYHKGFEPLPAGFKHVPYGDLDALAKAVHKHTAAILVEPVQGEGGIRPAPKGYLAGIRKLCDEHGLLMMLDEVQTGMGRTGTLWAFQGEAGTEAGSIVPDALSMAKALGNGIPIGAMLCKDSVGSALGPGTHASTFGGNPLAAAVACEAFDLISAPSLLENVRAVGEHLMGKLRAIRHDALVEVRGKGLLVGVELTIDAAKVVARARDLGLLINLAGEKVARFAPALIVTREQADKAVAIFEKALADAAKA